MKTHSNVIQGDRLPESIPITPLITMSRSNPYLAFERMRAKGSVFQSPLNGVFIVTGLKEAHQALKDPKLGRSDLMSAALMQHARGPEALDMYRATMLFTDPPAHGRLRAFMSRAFQPKTLEGLRGSVEKIVVAQLDRLKKKKRIDIISSFARPMPVEVIAQVIGVPESDWDQCIAWSADLAPVIDAIVPHGVVDRAIKSGFEFGAYVRDLVARRRKTPEDDVLTALIRGLDEPDGLTEDELVSNTMVLFTAGHETTMNLIGNSFVLLSQYPEQRALFDQDPEKHLDGLIEESLRFEPPVQLSARLAREDTEVGGHLLRAGNAVWVMIGAANRDPERFSDPQRFDITRDPNPHVSFGSGIHYCIGAALARLETRVAFEHFFRRYPKWKLAPQDLELRETTTLRGYQRVEIDLKG